MPSAPGGLLRRLRSAASGVPLRLRLVASVLVLVAIALALSGVVATARVRSFSLSQVDERLRGNMRSVAGPCLAGEQGGQGRLYPGGGPDGEGGLSNYYRACVSTKGVLTALGDGADDLASGEVPPDLPVITSALSQRVSGKPFSVEAVSGPGSWRVLVVQLPNQAGSGVLAQSITDVSGTVKQLILLQVVIGAAVLLLIAVLSYLLVRRSLRPLVAVERTAVAIAAGNLGRRVPAADPRTEVGRLSAALNAMLHQIEGAFRQQEKSEASARSAAAAARASAESARTSEERMRRFVADASHELRTPLTSIRGFAELHRQQPDLPPAEAERFMRRIEDEARRMGLLVDDLLLLARLDQQRPLERHEVDLLTLAADAAHDARVLAPDRSVQLEVVGGGVPPVVVGDEARLRQVIGNLVSNALAHTPAGTPVTVRVGVDEREATGQALVEVADAGPGLTPEEAARVFERFYRADASRTRASGGSGLGLSIVAALVAAHSGRVEVDATPGGGATFRVRLPLAPAVAVR